MNCFFSANLFLLKHETKPSLAQLFTQIRDEYATRDSSVGELLEIFNKRGYGVLLFFLLIPSLQPIPIPGLGSAFGVLVALHGFAMVFSVRPKLPARLARIPIKSETMRAICNGCCKVFGIVETLVKPRLTVFASHRFFCLLNGIVVLVGGILLALPLVIPLSNLIPALLVLFICLGTLEDDGIMILLGYTYAALLGTLFAVFGPQIFEFIKNIF